MQRKIVILSFFLTVVLIISCSSQKAVKTIEVFHKAKDPAMKTLERVKPVVNDYRDEYKITCHVITDPENEALIEKYNLPETHFPFAVVINGKFSAKIDGKKIDFAHFPLFMHGIGRHEGNWSLEALEKVLEDNSLLMEENILPEIEH